MQAHYPAQFARDVGCTVAEWLRWLPGATDGRALSIAHGAARVELGAGQLQLQWSELSPRRIALVQMPRLAVSFRFDGVADDVRQSFMRHFDLYMQRGGG